MKYEIREIREEGKRKRRKMAIFDENGKQISELFDDVWESGLVKGQSNYYIAMRNRKWAIFDFDGNMITPKWFDYVSSFGLVEGRSDYYLVLKDNKMAIFDKDGNRISDWFDEISGYALLKGESPYYMARKNGKWAIFDINGYQITPEWFDQIYSGGLYYIACNRVYDKHICAVYHIDGQKVSEDFSLDIGHVINITFNENLGIVEIEKKYNKKPQVIEFNPVIRKKEEFLDYTKLLNI
jgi:hypothetical protein